MGRVPRIMTDLHSISDKIAKNTHSVSGKDDKPLPADETHAPKIDPQVQQSIQNELAAAENRKSDARLDRRLAEYIANRRDLLEQMTTMISKTESLSAALKSESEKLNAILTELNLLNEHFPENRSQKNAFTTLKEYAESAESLEQIRLALIRLNVRMESMQAGTTSEKQLNGESFLLLLKSLSFGQLSRFGCALGFGLLIVLLILGALIAFAIVGAFKGYF